MKAIRKRASKLLAPQELPPAAELLGPPYQTLAFGLDSSLSVPKPKRLDQTDPRFRSELGDDPLSQPFQQQVHLRLRADFPAAKV